MRANAYGGWAFLKSKLRSWPSKCATHWSFDRNAASLGTRPSHRHCARVCDAWYVPHSLAWRWTRFRSGRRRVASWRRRRRILRWRVSGIAAGRRRGGRPIPRRRPIPRGRRRVITRRHTPATIWTKTIAGRAHASIWDAVAISVTMKSRAAASRHKKNIRFREWSCEPCSRGTLCTVGKHQACERDSKRNR
jgi:hypothetical protein